MKVWYSLLYKYNVFFRRQGSTGGLVFRRQGATGRSVFCRQGATDSSVFHRQGATGQFFAFMAPPEVQFSAAWAPPVVQFSTSSSAACTFFSPAAGAHMKRQNTFLKPLSQRKNKALYKCSCICPVLNAKVNENAKSKTWRCKWTCTQGGTLFLLLTEYEFYIFCVFPIKSKFILSLDIVI